MKKLKDLFFSNKWKILFETQNHYKTSKLQYEKEMHVSASHLFFPLNDEKLSSSFECKVVWLPSWQTTDKPQFYLIANRG